jgi:para-nitrobenzyl esterase
MHAVLTSCGGAILAWPRHPSGGRTSPSPVFTDPAGAIRRLALACGTCLVAAAGVPAPAGPVVHTAQGDLVGRALFSGGGVFKGIAYAQPPVGPLRWRLPQPLIAWRGQRDAGAYGAACPQPETVWSKGAPPTSEDCLLLNVWSPSLSKHAALPVMVFIHGGGFMNGSGNALTYQGTALAAKGVVVVTINYRLGVFGFLAAPQLSAESPRHVSGNYGLADQLAALRWVRANIAAFGGDPAKVTVFGQSAGAASISDLLTSPLAPGLFRAAIIESGPAGVPSGRIQNLSQAEADGRAFFAGQNASALRALAAPEVLRRWKAFADAHGLPRVAPIVDGWLLRQPPFDVYRAHRELPVPILIGTNARDNLFHDDASRLAANLRAAYGPNAPAALQLYGVNGGRSGPPDPAGGTATEIWGTDRGMRCPTIMQELWHAEQGAAVYAYQFEQSLPGLPAAGAAHAYELPYVFGYLQPTPRIPATYGAQDHALSAFMQAYWTDFAKTGNPNGAGLPVWPRYDPRGRAYMRFSYAGPQLAHNLRGPACALYQRQFFH